MATDNSTNTCSTCKHWKVLKTEERFDSSFNGADNIRVSGFNVGRCLGVLEFNRPMINGQATVRDGSLYMAQLISSPGFGCTLHEASDG